MTAINNLSATQFGPSPTPTPQTVAQIPRGLSGTPSQVSSPLPSTSSTNTSQGRRTAWRTNSGEGPMPISSRTLGTTMRFDS